MSFAEGPQASAVLRRSKLQKSSHAIFQGYQFFSVARWFCSKELVVAIAGLALPGTIGTIGKGPVVALKDDSHCKAALITFLGTLSGVVIAWRWCGLLGRGRGRVRAVCTTIRAIPLRRALQVLACAACQPGTALTATAPSPAKKP